ncbi:MAG: ComF family protein [Myxococcota bacterium]
MFRAALEGLLDLLAPPRCPGCDVTNDWGTDGFCEVCHPLLEPRSSGPALYDYGGPMAEAIRRLKYGGRTDVVAPLAELLRAAANRHRGKVDAVVPVPLHLQRLAERGFNAPELLSVALAADLGVPVDIRCLSRTRPTPPQASLKEAERDANVRGAFVAQGPPRRVLLVDDVRTTGSTMRAAAGALHRAGAAQVRMLTLAATP